MKRVLAFLTVIVMALGLCSCKSSFSSKIGDVKDALEETCHAKKANDDQYDKMVDTLYKIEEVAEDFKEGVYTEVDAKDRAFFGFHASVDQGSVKSLFKYLKADPESAENDSVARMEVLVIQFKNSDNAQAYFEALMNSAKQNYRDYSEGVGVDIKTDIVEKKEYFAFACETDLMTFNEYASIEGSTVMYASIAGTKSDSLKAEYYAFMKKMECSIITL